MSPFFLFGLVKFILGFRCMHNACRKHLNLFRFIYLYQYFLWTSKLFQTQITPHLHGTSGAKVKDEWSQQAGLFSLCWAHKDIFSPMFLVPLRHTVMALEIHSPSFPSLALYHLQLTYFTLTSSTEYILFSNLAWEGGGSSGVVGFGQKNLSNMNFQIYRTRCQRLNLAGGNEFW